MSIGQISLSASARQNLIALQNTSKLLGTTQSHLSTGKKVNSALDGAASYFASQGFINSANDLSSLKDNMSTALQTIKAASDAISSVTDVVSQLQGIVNSALQSTDATTRASYATQYNALLANLDDLVNDATFNGTNLVNSLVSELKVNFNATNTTSLTVEGANLTSTGMGLGQAQNSFAANTRAKDIVDTMTVTSTSAGNTLAYSGTLDLTGRVGSDADSSSGLNAAITSTAADFSTTASLTDGATATITSYTAGSAGLLEGDAAEFLGTQIAGLTLTGGTAIVATTDLTATTIQGQFTANGLANSAYDDATNTLSTNTTDASATLVIAAGQSIQINFTQGAGAKHAIYANQGTSAVTITLGYATTADTVSVGAAGKANSTAEYRLSAGTVSYTGLELAAGQTVGTSQIVDAGGATLGQDVTVYSTQDGTGSALGTTTSTGVNAYDMSSATLSGFASSSIVAKVDGVASATYSLAAGSNVTFAGATQLTGTAVTTVADSLSTAQTQLSRALTTLRSVGASLGNNNTLVQTRETYTSNLISTLQTASDNLVLADTNEEGANMQALQAQSQLGIVALGISGQQAQAILKLF